MQRYLKKTFYGIRTKLILTFKNGIDECVYRPSINNGIYKVLVVNQVDKRVIVVLDDITKAVDNIQLIYCEKNCNEREIIYYDFETNLVKRVDKVSI